MSNIKNSYDLYMAIKELSGFIRFHKNWVKTGKYKLIVLTHQCPDFKMYYNEYNEQAYDIWWGEKPHPDGDGCVTSRYSFSTKNPQEMYDMVVLILSRKEEEFKKYE